MTKKKRELIEILLDNVNPEDWPERFHYAAQDKTNSMIYIYSNIPDISSIHDGKWHCSAFSFKSIDIQVELCKLWNKTIVHRDEFMKRWNERNRVLVSITDQPPAVMDSAKYEALEFTEICGDKEDPVAYKSTKLKSPLVQIVDSEGWIQWNGGEMPVEKGTLIDVKYRRGSVNLHVKAGEIPSGGSIPHRCAIDFKHDDVPGDIIAYRLHVQQEQKTPQQLALEKFGADWHENEGMQPVFDNTKIDVVLNISDEVKENIQASSLMWSKNDRALFAIKKWRIHSDDKESKIDKASKSLSDAMGKLNGVLPTAQQAVDWFKNVAEAMGGADIEPIKQDENTKNKLVRDLCGALLMDILNIEYPNKAKEFVLRGGITNDERSEILKTLEEPMKEFKQELRGGFVGIEKVISDRGNNYGRFEDGAEIMQHLKLIAHTSQGWERMKPVQREGMDMILHKIGRILNGDPAYVDSWVDIEGYSNLVSSWLKGESK